jgi:hypothetical protein
MSCPLTGQTALQPTEKRKRLSGRWLIKQYEDRYQAQKLQGLVKHAKSMGFQIVPLSQ